MRGALAGGVAAYFELLDGDANAVVAQFNIYGQPLILTGFANNEGNAVLLMYVYENAIKKQVAGISAAMALVLGVCIMVVSFIQIRLMRANASD